MASPLRPKGPLPPRVYWVRRALVLGVPIVLVGVLAQVLSGDADPSARTAEGTVQLASEGQSGPQPTSEVVGPTAPAGKKGKKKNKPSPPPTPVLAEPTGPCEVSDVRITPSVPNPITADGLQIDFAVTSVTSPACTWSFTPETVSIAITSGSDDIWFSRHCSALVPTSEVVARPETPGVVSMMWNLRRSDEECSRNTEWVRLGYYHVSASPLGGEPTSVQFQLTRPPAEVVTKTVTPTPTPTKGKKHRQGDDGAGVDEPDA